MLLGLAGCESTYDRKDLANAPWHRKAAEEGNAVSQYFLGLWYAEGRGVRQDDGEAVTWFRKAAEQGIAEAHFYLGLMHSKGRACNRIFQGFSRTPLAIVGTPRR